ALAPPPPVPPCVAPPVEGVLLAPAMPLPPLPPLAGWVVPPDGLASRGVWLLLAELQPTPIPAAHNSTKAAVK
ncbi:MAG: transglycosylase, partial [Polyangia bacterium]